jgi:hypothetical protein
MTRRFGVPGLSSLYGLIYLAIFDLISGGSSASAETPPSTPAPSVPNPSSGGNISNFLNSGASYQFWLTCMIVLFGIAIVICLIWSVGRAGAPKPEDYSRPLIIVTVIIGALILVTAGYSNDQIAPAFGLFGTIIGYVLGRLAQSPQQPAPAPDAVGAQNGDRGTNQGPAPADAPAGAPSARRAVTP